MPNFPAEEEVGNASQCIKGFDRVDCSGAVGACSTQTADGWIDEDIRFATVEFVHYGVEEFVSKVGRYRGILFRK